MIGRLLVVVMVLAASSVAKAWSHAPEPEPSTVASITSLPTASEARSAP